MSEYDTEKVVSVSVFKALAQLAEQVKKRMASASGELGERIKNAVEDGGLHAGAFKQVVRLNRMDVLKRNAFLRHFDLYRDYAEREFWAGDTADMFDDDHDDEPSAAEVKADADKKAAAKNAKAIKNGIKPLTDDEKAFDAGEKPAAKVVGFPGAEGKALN